MSKEQLSLGSAIDRIVEALESLDEKSRSTALSAVCAHLGITTPNTPVATGSNRLPLQSELQASKPALTAQKSHKAVVDIRTLKADKQPTSTSQMACLVAFYLQEHAPEHERSNTVTTQDLEKYFKQAGFKLPKKMQQVLIDAKRAGYFDSTGRGEYRLNAVGYNLVAHSLPSSSAS